MDFYNNKKNDTLKFKLNAEGIDMRNMEARLIFRSKNSKNMLLVGTINEGYCIFDVPELNIYEKDEHGDVKFEVVASDGNNDFVYFQPWKNTFNVKSQASMKVEEVIETIAKTKEKPSISASVEIVQSKEPEKKIPKKRIFENKQVEEEIKIDPELNPYKDIKEYLKTDEEKVEKVVESKEEDEIEVELELPNFEVFRKGLH